METGRRWDDCLGTLLGPEGPDAYGRTILRPGVRPRGLLLREEAAVVCPGQGRLSSYAAALVCERDGHEPCTPPVS